MSASAPIISGPDDSVSAYPVELAPGFAVYRAADGVPGVDDDGVYNTVGKIPLFICAPLHVIAYARTAEAEEWGKILRFKDIQGGEHQWLLPLSLLARDTVEIRSKLLSRGLRMSASKFAPDLLRQYLQLTEPKTYALTVNRIGWTGETFVFPDENVGPPNGKMLFFQPAWEMSHRLRTAGTLDEWRENIGRYCSKISRLLFCVSCAAAAPLLYFFGEQSGGFHLVGDTTVGKTTCLMVAGSFWGGGGQNGFVQSWQTTASALENTAEWHNNVLLLLDELKLIDPEQASKVIYSLSNGQNKGRAGSDMRARRNVEWQLLFLSTGELGLASHLQSAATQKQRTYGGQEVRFCEIPAEVGADGDGGMFEFAHEFEGGPRPFQSLSDHLKIASRAYYGSASRDYLYQLAKMGYDNVRSAIQQYQKRFSDRFIQAEIASEAARAGLRFSLVGAAGELATALGITGWEPGEALAATGKIFNAWLLQRGSNGSFDENQALKHIQSMLIAHGNSRFQYFIDGQKGDETSKVPNRIGFRTRKDGDTEYIVLPAMFPELCGQFPEALVLRTLKKHGFLKFDSGHQTTKRAVPELDRRPRCYVISGQICSSEGEPESAE
jgi:putative DNA primase/helicase